MFYINQAHDSYNLIKEEILFIRRRKLYEESEETEVIVSFKSFFNKDDVDYLTIESFKEDTLVEFFIEWLSNTLSWNIQPVCTFKDFKTEYDTSHRQE